MSAVRIFPSTYQDNASLLQMKRHILLSLAASFSLARTLCAQATMNVALISDHGSAISASADGNISARAAIFTADCKFALIHYKEDLYFLRTVHGTHVSARIDGTCSVVPQLDSWEIFRLQRHEDRLVFLTHHNTYLCVEEDGRLVSNRKAVGPWELFRFLPFPDENPNLDQVPEPAKSKVLKIAAAVKKTDDLHGGGGAAGLGASVAAAAIYCKNNKAECISLAKEAYSLAKEVVLDVVSVVERFQRDPEPRGKIDKTELDKRITDCEKMLRKN